MEGPQILGVEREVQRCMGTPSGETIRAHILSRYCSFGGFEDQGVGVAREHSGVG